MDLWNIYCDPNKIYKQIVNRIKSFISRCNIFKPMSGSFAEDLVSLGRILLLTFFLLGIFVIYNQKIAQGIILLALVCQLLLIWILVDKYNLIDTVSSFFEKTGATSTRSYLYVIILGFTFIIGFFFLFRAIIIIQQSILNYGSIKTNYYMDIILAATFGIGVLIIFIALSIYYHKFLKGSGRDLIITNWWVMLSMIWSVQVE